MGKNKIHIGVIGHVRHGITLTEAINMTLAERENKPAMVKTTEVKPIILPVIVGDPEVDTFVKKPKRKR